MQTTPQPGLGSRGIAVPVVFWPSTYVPQQICCLAASPEGSVLAAACSSGQVYLWSCAADARGAVRLDPAALALGGWLGPAEVLGLDFCLADGASRAAGLGPGLLLCCLLAGGRVRLLDAADGRCVAALPARAAGAGPAALRVLGDGRHALLAAGAGEAALALLDLWAGREVLGLPAPGGAPVLGLAAPRRGGRAAAAGAELQLAAVTARALSAWRWGGADGGGRAPARPQVSFTFDLGQSPQAAEGAAPPALAFDGGFLVLGLGDRVLVWMFGGDPTGPPELYLDWKIPQGAGPAEVLGGAAVVLPDLHGGAAARSPGPPDDVLSRSAGPRARSATPARRGGPTRAASAGPPPPTLVVWTAQGRVFRSALDGATARTARCDALLRPWASLPAALPRGAGACWWSLGPLLVGAAPGPSGDRLHLRAAPPPPCSGPRRWTCAADLREQWRPRAAARGARAAVACAALVQAGERSWLALGLEGGSGGAPAAPLCALELAGPGGPAAAPRPLAAPAGFAAPRCLAALGPRFLACGDARGSVCWWALPGLGPAGQAQPACRAAVVALARVWSPHEDALAPEPSLLAALDELGKCRVLDLATGELRCCLQSQRGLSLWIDEPLRMIYDPAGQHIWAATPSRSWVWDLESGAFERSVAEAAPGAPPEDAPEARSRAPARHRDPGAPAGGGGRGLLRSPGFGVDAVAWQAPALPPAAEAAPAPAVAGAPAPAGPRPAWWLGDALLDGPLWRLPVMLVSPAGLLAGTAGSDGGQAPEATEAPLAEGLAVSETSCSCMPRLVGDAVQHLEAQLASLGVHLPEPPFIVGSLGVDDSLSLPLPRRRGLATRSLPPTFRGARVREKQVLASATSSSRELLQALYARGHTGRSPAASSVTRGSFTVPRCPALPEDRAPLCGAAGDEPDPAAEVSSKSVAPPALACQQWSPHMSLAFVAHLLLHADSPQHALQWCALPAVRCILRGAAALPAIRGLSAWAEFLQARPGGEAEAPALARAAFGSAAGLRDAATLVLALVAHAQPRLFERRCAPVAAQVAGGLCARALGGAGGGAGGGGGAAVAAGAGAPPRLRSLCCEVLAAAFPLWRRHLAAAMAAAPGRSVPGAGRGAGAAGPAAPAAAAGPAAAGAGPAGARAGAGAAAGQLPGPDEGGGDECLEWLAAQMLTLQQEPRVAASSLAVLMQVGAADPATLLQVMGKAARRLDLGAAYTSSALFVLLVFVQRFASKVLPLLSRFTEAVLRCLEPSDPSLRRQSLQAVTRALHELVQTFPMVAFHQQSQKFAVGTGEGLVVVYDLRTATKWRILEGHSGVVAALAFSRDGARLGSYSALDRSVRLWQCSPTGLLGGFLGTGGRCLERHALPALPPAGAPGGAAPGAWRAVALSWTEPGALGLVRENGEACRVGLGAA